MQSVDIQMHIVREAYLVMGAYTFNNISPRWQPMRQRNAESLPRLCDVVKVRPVGIVVAAPPPQEYMCRTTLRSPCERLQTRLL